MPTLRSREDFARIQAKGRTRAHRLMVVRFLPNALGYDRFGIATGRRIGGSVTRNRIRRRIREVLRQATEPGGAGWDILIVVRPPSADASFAEVRGALEWLLGAVHDSSAMRSPS